jgi:hypothetical protein
MYFMIFGQKHPQKFALHYGNILQCLQANNMITICAKKREKVIIGAKERTCDFIFVAIWF